MNGRCTPNTLGTIRQTCAITNLCYNKLSWLQETGFLYSQSVRYIEVYAKAYQCACLQFIPAEISTACKNALLDCYETIKLD